MPIRIPAPDWGDVLPGETLLEWLQRTDAAQEWEADEVTGEPVANLDTDAVGTGDYRVRPIISSRQFASLTATFTPPEIVFPPTAPVWPGSGAVELGEVVGLADQAVIEGPMSGILVNITTPPSRVGQRLIGGSIYDYNVGEVAFESDAGDLEPWQYIGFRQAIYTPKSIQLAARARFRVLAGASGTAQAWTIG